MSLAWPSHPSIHERELRALDRLVGSDDDVELTGAHEDVLHLREAGVRTEILAFAFGHDVDGRARDDGIEALAHGDVERQALDAVEVDDIARVDAFTGRRGPSDRGARRGWSGGSMTEAESASVCGSAVVKSSPMTWLSPTIFMPASDAASRSGMTAEPAERGDDDAVVAVGGDDVLELRRLQRRVELGIELGDDLMPFSAAISSMAAFEAPSQVLAELADR